MHILTWYHRATHHIAYKEAAEDSLVCAHNVLQSERSTSMQNTVRSAAGRKTCKLRAAAADWDHTGYCYQRLHQGHGVM